MKTMRKTLRFIAAPIVALGVVTSAPLSAQTTVQLPPFTSVELPKGGHVTFQRGAVQRVTLVRGSLEHSRFTVTGGRLVVEKCSSKCPRGYKLEIEVITPSLTGISLANGGRITTRGGFPRQGELTVAVAHGGMIDVRSMIVDRVTASVEHGGGIMTTPQAELSARVTQGGVITYWGEPRVRSSVTHGGAVQRGDPSQLSAPLTSLR
jgi:hypothetical protein